MAARKTRLTHEQIDKELDNERLRLFIWFALTCFAGAAVLLLASVPLAKAIADTDTNFNLNISLGFNFALAVTTATGGAASYQLNRRRQHHAKRVRQLERRVQELESGSAGRPTANPAYSRRS